MLDEQLKALAASDVYPFHMPGHKRQPIAMENPYAIDITEIPGFDNLHDPQDVILEAMLIRVFTMQPGCVSVKLFIHTLR